jgi:hypothetical protein
VLPSGDGGGVGPPIRTDTLGSVRSPEEPRWFGPPFSPSDALGVGKSRTATERGVPCPFPFTFFTRFRWRRSSQDRKSSPSFGFDAVGVGRSGNTTCESGGRNPSEARRPGVPVSEARGVGSRPGDEEDSVALVGGTDIGRSQATPFRIEPEAGQVCKNGAECPQRALLGSEVSQTPRAGFHVAVGF